jgi:hypothetical protein
MLIAVSIIIFCLVCIASGYGMSNPEGLPKPGFLARVASK